MLTYINATVPVKNLRVHLENEPDVQIDCQMQGSEPGYAVIHLGSNCAVFPSDAQVLKLEAALREYIDRRAAIAESAATGAQAAFEIQDHAAAIAADSELF
jgi:hypothetical protein